MQRDVIESARGRWKGILGSLGLAESFLRDQHGPCPMCGGKDRYRWDNKDGRGTFYCNGCGSGDGVKLLTLYHGWNFPKVLKEVSDVMGLSDYEKPKPEMSDQARRDNLRKLWKLSKPVQKGDIVDMYFAARGIDEITYPQSLRTCEKCWFSDQQYRSAMIALIKGPDGKAVSLHRTYLSINGSKLDVPEPRRLMPGNIPAGSAIQLGTAGHVLGIAEGIETAFAAMQRFDMPVWAAINATMLKQWEPPHGVEEVVVFGDNDKKFGGQSAAFTLAHRLAVKGFKTSVTIPQDVGKDWADYTGSAA